METKKDLYPKDLFDVFRRHVPALTVNEFVEKTWETVFPGWLLYLFGTKSEIITPLLSSRIHGVQPNDIMVVGDRHVEYFNMPGIDGVPCYAMYEDGVCFASSWLGVTWNYKYGLLNMIYNQTKGELTPYTYGTVFPAYGGDISEIEAFYWPHVISSPHSKVEVEAKYITGEFGYHAGGNYTKQNVKVFNQHTSLLLLSLSAEDGLINGQLTAYYEDGTIAETIDYKYGVIKGLHKRYDRHGDQIYTKRYE
jgi:hypothetical protein